MRQLAFLTSEGCDLSHQINRDSGLGEVLAILKGQHGLEGQLVPCQARHEVDWQVFDKVFMCPTLYQFYLDNYLESVELLKSLKAKGIRVGNGVDCLLWNSDKTYLTQLRDAGIPIPKTLFVEKDDQIEDIIRQVDLEFVQKLKMEVNLVVKPMIGAGGVGVHRAESCAELTEVLGSFSANEGKVNQALMIQEFVPEFQKNGEISLVFFGEKFSHAFLKTNENDFKVQSCHGGKVSPLEADDDMVALGNQILSLVPHKERPLDYARIDLVKRSNGDLQLSELEMFEPMLYTTEQMAPGSIQRYIDVLMALH